MENSEIFKTMKRQCNILITDRIMTGWRGEHWYSQNNEKTMEHSEHWEPAPFTVRSTPDFRNTN
jgi:hypothetical protein